MKLENSETQETAMKFIWDEAAFNLMKELWAADYSAALVAAHLTALGRGKVTRSMVCGKINRARYRNGSTEFEAHRKGNGGHKLHIKQKPGEPRIVKPNTGGHNKARPALPSMPSVNTKTEPNEKPYVLKELEPQLVKGERVTILTLGHGMCKWPIGDPRSPDFHFCGHAQMEGKVYCEHHCKVSYMGTIYKPDKNHKPQRGTFRI